MNNQDLTEQLKFSHPHSLYIVTWNNLLKQLFTPFKVVVIKSVGPLAKGQMVWVEQVKVNSNLITVFIVDGGAYYFYHFEIIID